MWFTFFLPFQASDVTSTDSTFDIQSDKRDLSNHHQRQTKKSRTRRGNRGRAPVSANTTNSQSTSANNNPGNVLGQNTQNLLHENKQQTGTAAACTNSTVNVNNVTRGTKVQWDNRHRYIFYLNTFNFLF